MKHLGDYAPNATVRCWFNTSASTGAPITLAGSPTVRVYKGGSTTEDDSGITLTVDFDGVTGLHVVTIDTSADAAFYTASNDFAIVLTAGTVDSVSVVGSVIAEFSIQNRAPTNNSVGENAIAVTVLDNTDDFPIPNALVRAISASGQIWGPVAANASGVVNFSLVDGTWVFYASASGFYNLTSAATVVSASGSQTLTMFPVDIAAADAGEVTGYLYVYDEDNNLLAGAEVEIALKSSTGVAGRALYRKIKTYTSDVGGLISAALLENSTYEGRLKYAEGVYGDWVEFTTAETSPVALPEILGKRST